MKMTINDLWKKYKNAQADAARRAEEIKQAEAALASLKAQQEDAAAEGNQAAFDALDEDIRKATNRITVLIKSSRRGVVTPEDCSEFWREYAADFKKDQEKRMLEYRKTQKQACEQYEKMVEAQNTAFHVREDLGTMTGVFDGSDQSREEVERRYHLSGMLPGNDINKSILDHPENVYFTGSGLWQKAPADETLNTIVRLGRSVNKPYFGHN